MGRRRKKDPAAIVRGRLGGLKGGRARADKMTDEQRKASSANALKVRWDRYRAAKEAAATQ
jgi:hypothetical protein